MMFVRLLHWFWGHPNVEDIQEDHAVIEDVIAGTGHIQMSGWCPQCKQHIYWNEDNT